MTKFQKIINKITWKIAKLFGIKFCGCCGKCIWWSKKTLRLTDDPEDTTGYIAPICENCQFFFEEKYSF